MGSTPAQIFGARFLGIVFFVLIAAAMRLIPHPPNFTPIAAMALFGGAYFGRKVWALGLPLAALFLSDLVIGFHDLMLPVYVSFLLVGFLGMNLLHEKRNLVRVGSVAITGSVAFFLITNFAVWAVSGMYPMTFEGLVTCYVMALPFLHYSLAGDLFFNAVLFGGFALAAKGLPALPKAA